MFKKQVRFLRNKTVPGSEVAQDKWSVEKKYVFLEKNLPQAAKLPGTSGFFKKHDFLEKNLPQAAKLPGTSGFFKKKKSDF